MIATVTLGLAACSPSSTAPAEGGEGTAAETAKISMHIYPGALISLPTFVAEAEGIWAKHGLEVEQLSFASGPEATQAAVAGSLTFLDTSPSVVNIANENFANSGSDSRLLAVAGGVAKSLHYSIVGGPGIDWPDPSDQDAVLDALEDKTIGVTVVGADTQNVFMGLMEITGHDPSKANFVGVGIGASAVAAVTTGQVDALVSAPPAGERVVDDGGVTLIDFRTGDIDPAFDKFLQTVYYASNDWLENNEEVAHRVQAALVESIAFIQDPANLDRVTEIYVGESEGLDFDTARDAVERYIPLFTPSLSCQGFQNMNDFYINYTDTFKNALTCDEIIWSGAEEFIVD